MKLKFGMAEFSLFAGFGCAIGIAYEHHLIKNRLKPALEADVVYLDGRYIPMEEYIELILPNLFIHVPAFIIVSILSYLFMKNKEREKNKSQNNS